MSRRSSIPPVLFPVHVDVRSWFNKFKKKEEERSCWTPDASFRTIRLSDEPYYFNERKMFFSYNKSVNNTFSHAFFSKMNRAFVFTNAQFFHWVTKFVHYYHCIIIIIIQKGMHFQKKMRTQTVSLERFFAARKGSRTRSGWAPGDARTYCMRLEKQVNNRMPLPCRGAVASTERKSRRRRLQNSGSCARFSALFSSLSVQWTNGEIAGHRPTPHPVARFVCPQMTPATTVWTWNFFSILIFFSVKLN